MISSTNEGIRILDTSLYEDAEGRAGMPDAEVCFGKRQILSLGEPMSVASREDRTMQLRWLGERRKKGPAM